MKYGFYSPGFGSFSDPRVLAELARDAEASGWDGYFLWDHMQFTMGGGNAPVGDTWVTMAAMAAATSRIRLGALVTPIARRRPWKLAREATTLDILSGGRLVFGAGIGSDQFGREFSAFGEPADDITHAEMLDEGLDVIAGLWSGEPFSYEGKHYHVRDVTFLPTPVQRPRIPVWLAGTWPVKKPFRRAARWDGIMPMAREGGLTPADYRDMLAYMSEFRTGRGLFDIVRGGFLPKVTAAEVAEKVAEFEDSGVTWWLVPLEDDMGPLDELRERILQGPPTRV